MPPPERHSKAFSLFHALAEGESFILINDHDPRPLNYQFESKHNNAFDWTYLEQGPELWKIRITKTASESRSKGTCCGSCGG
jgi:uncharacterized protein (DUF2249 family)